uniref:Putative secreted peptide n=1 Tax=Anopheles braziliensis TaxID=58242 RepID=A0A2M3ZMJ4_9DIPT
MSVCVCVCLCLFVLLFRNSMTIIHVQVPISPSSHVYVVFLSFSPNKPLIIERCRTIDPSRSVRIAGHARCQQTILTLLNTDPDRLDLHKVEEKTVEEIE